MSKMQEVNPKWNEGYKLIVPPGTADTTVSRDGYVYVKYNDFDFYPLHLVYYYNDYDDDGGDGAYNYYYYYDY